MFDSDYGYIKGEKVFRKGFRNFPDRQIGEVKTDEASSIAYFEERFLQAERKVEGLEKAVEAAENKGSYLMRLIHLKEYLINIDAIGDFEALYIRLENLEERLKELIAINRANNLIIKNNLIAEAEALRGSTNWREDTEKFKDIKARWVKTGNVEKEFEKDLESRFSSILTDFFNKRQAYYQEKHRLAQGKLSLLREINEKAKKAVNKLPYEAKKELKLLQEEWKKVGKVPGHVAKALYKEFRATNDRVFKPKASFSVSREGVNVSQILEEKENMVARAKELSCLPTPSKADVDEVQTLQKDWKRKGILPRDQNKVLAKVFYGACSLVLEKYFIVNLAIKKQKDFLELSEKEQLQIKIRLTQDLLTRDQLELETFQENLDKINPSADDVNKMVNVKFNQQARKVFVKKCLLEEYKSELRRK